MTESPFIRSIAENDFDQGVLEASFRQPVLVDFWADWCQPCRVLMPLLAKLAQEYGGKFLLAKVNTEENPRLATQHGIRSLPTVRLYKDGKVADEFMGALPEAQIRAFLDRHIPKASDLLSSQAEALIDQGQLEEAARLLEQASAIDPAHAGTRISQARLAMARDQNASALEILQGLDEPARRRPEVAAMLAHLSLSEGLAQAPDAEALRQRLARDENNSEARYLLALRAIEGQEYETALELLLTLLRKDRRYCDGAAQRTLLQVFDLLGGEGALVARYRGKMFNALH